MDNNPCRMEGALGEVFKDSVGVGLVVRGEVVLVVVGGDCVIGERIAGGEVAWEAGVGVD